jgi:hypothetical protein
LQTESSRRPFFKRRDPGYGSTSKMIAERALCVVRDVQGEAASGRRAALMDLRCASV